MRSVSCVSASSSSSATRLSQALATEPTSVIWAALRPSSVARYCATAASLRLRRRPKKSSSQADKASPAWKVVVSLPESTLGARLAVAATPTVGKMSARRMSYCARACSTVSSATRRSRLLASAVAISPRSFWSAKNCCQSSAAACVPSAAAGKGKAPGTGAAGRS